MYYKFNGYALIELMLALLMSAFIVSSVFTIYLATQNINQAQIALTTIEERSRIAISLLSADLRMAGYTGCAKLRTGYPHSDYAAFSLTNENRIQPYHGIEVKEGSSGLTVRHADSQNAVLLTSMNQKEILYISSIPHFSLSDVLLVSDCKKSELFKAKEVGMQHDGIQKIVSEKPLHDLYGKNAEISLFDIDTYFVGRTNRLNVKGEAIYALYRLDNQFHKSEWIEGVEDMKMQYDILEGDRLVEKEEKEIIDWSKVVGISIMFTLSSNDTVPIKKNVYLYVSLPAL